MKQYEGNAGQRWGHISYAQCGDDFFLMNLFELLGIEKPSYLDLGAHHPVNLSNTAMLYARGSRGINVEANPGLMPYFHQLRPGDVNLNVGVGPVAGMLPFFMNHQEGATNTFSPQERDKWMAEGHAMTGEILLPLVTVNEIIKKHRNGFWPHLLNIDIEGLDYAVLDSADFGFHRPAIICVETRGAQSQKMVGMMTQKGFTFHTRIVENLFFVQTALAHKIF